MSEVQNTEHRNQVVKQVFEVAKKGPGDAELDFYVKYFEIPIIDDLSGKTALDEALGVRERRD